MNPDSRNRRPTAQTLTEAIAAAWPVEAWASVNVAVAISGGPDSMALLRALLGMSREIGSDGAIYAIHINHGIRGSADDDERWLRHECTRLSVDFHSSQVDAHALADREGDGLEAAARRLRYDALTETAERLGARYVATGHTHDDQIETVLFRMFRGTGLRGMAGMRFVRPLTPCVSLVRPLLDVRRSEIEAYLTAIGQNWRVDKTNWDVRYSRNLIRQKILPVLREHINQDVEAAVARLARQAAETDQVLTSLAASMLEQCQPAIQLNDSFELSVGPLRSAPRLIVRDALRLAWRKCGLPEQQMSFDAWERLTSLAIGEDDGAVELPRRIVASRDKSTLSVQVKNASS